MIEDILFTIMFWIGFITFVSAGCLGGYVILAFTFRTGNYFGIFFCGNLHNWKSFNSKEKKIFMYSFILVFFSFTFLSLSTVKFNEKGFPMLKSSINKIFPTH